MTAARDSSESVTPNPPAAAPSTAIQSAGRPPAAPTSTPTPAKKKRTREPWTPQRLTAALGRLDRVLVGLILVLGFELGAFAIQNSDYWMHLATGRALVQGEYRPGQPIFANVPEGVSWVNHAWLFDGMLYLVRQVDGDRGVIVIRALGIALLAVVLLACRRPGQGLAIPVFAIALALITASPRFLLQPVTASFVLLGVTLFLLFRTGDKAQRQLWLLPPLFALWVNLDTWFVLGPLTVFLALVGEMVQSRLAPAARPRLKTLGLVFVVGLAACLVNPYLFHVLELPTELALLLSPVLPGSLTVSGQTVHTWSQFQPNVFPSISPFTETYWIQPINRNAAGMLFYLLFVLSLGSFVLVALTTKRTTPRELPVALLLVWLPFGVLAVLQSRLIGLFAVVAGLVLMRNLQDVLAGRFGTTVRVERPWPSWLLGSRVILLVALVLLVGMSWGGWLHSAPDDARRSRHVAFYALGDPLWKDAGQRLVELRKAKHLKNGFNYTLDSANYWAWTSGTAAAHSFFDQRFGLFADNAAPFGKVKKALREEVEAFLSNKPRRSKAPMQEVQAVFRAHQINYLILGNLHTDPEAEGLFRRLSYEGQRWPLLYLDGHTAIFGWRDPQHKTDETFAGQEWDFQQLAFGKVPELYQAPPQGLAEVPQPLNWFTKFCKGPTPIAPTRNAVRMDLLYYDARKATWQRPYAVAAEVTQWLTGAATTAVVPAQYSSLTGWVLSVDARHRVHYANYSGWLAGYDLVTLHKKLGNKFQPQNGQSFFRPVDLGPPALPILAVRAARRAVVDAPDDALGHLLVALTTDQLRRDQEEHWSRRSPPVAGPFQGPRLLMRSNIRFLQCVIALNNAVRLQPENLEFRRQLYQMYMQREYLDMALEHLTAMYNHMRAGTATGVPRDQADKWTKDIEQNFKFLDGMVKKRRDDYELAAILKPSALGKFQIAMFGQPQDKTPRGLAALGLKLLQKADITKEKPQEVQIHIHWQLWLLLATGQVKEVQESLADEHVEKMLGSTFPQFKVLTAAALGNYQEAQQALTDLEKYFPLPKKALSARDLLNQMRQEQNLRFASFFVGMPLGSYGLPLPRPHFDLNLPLHIEGQINRILGAAEMRFLHGLLALEQGDTAEARIFFADCLRLAGPNMDFPDRPIAERYLQLLEKERK